MLLIPRSRFSSLGPWTYIGLLSMLSWSLIASAKAQENRFLSPLGSVPDWSGLDPYQRTITREEFERELRSNYAEYEPGTESPAYLASLEELRAAEEAAAIAAGELDEEPETEAEEGEPEAVEEPPPPYWAKFIEITDESAKIVTNSRRADSEVYELFFAEEIQPVKRYWRHTGELPPIQDPAKPLEGIRIVIDPGHIGGAWAQMEQRWFKVKAPEPKPEDQETPEGQAEAETEDPGEPVEPPKPDIPVMEGEIVLRVSQLLQQKLTKAGARVALVREENRPVTKKRPEDFYDHVRRVYGLPADADPETNYRLSSTANRLFYLTSEIRARSRKINQQFKPDLVLCLHVNAEAWGNPADPDFVNRNHFHILINGCYAEGEMLQDDQRYDMILRLLQRIHDQEVALSDTIAEVMGAEIRLPPYTYFRSNARRVSGSPYVWSRNLLATRTYQCPVVFFEPYVMNHELVYNRVQAGEYEGTREFEGRPLVNIYEEYAQSVASGVLEYYRRHRPYAPQE